MQNSELEIRSLNFTSLFRNGGTLGNPQFNINDTLNNIRGVKLKNAVLPLSFYTIDSRNNKLYFYEVAPGVDLVATIPEGIYTSSTLPGVLKTALELVGSNIYTITYSSVSNKLTITADNSFAFKQGSNNAYYELGLTSENLNVLSSTLTGNEVIDLSGVSCIHLLSSVGAINVINKPYNVIGTINIDRQITEVQNYKDDSQDYIAVSLNSLSELTFLLYDERFRILTPKKDWSITVNFLTE